MKIWEIPVGAAVIVGAVAVAGWAATPAVCPRGTGEGALGSSSCKWGSVYAATGRFDNLNVGGTNLASEAYVTNQIRGVSNSLKAMIVAATGTINGATVYGTVASASNAVNLGATTWTALTQQIEAAASGDTIYVAPAVYDSDNYMLTKRVNLIGSGSGKWIDAIGEPRGGTIFKGGFFCDTTWTNAVIEGIGFWSDDAVTAFGLQGSFATMRDVALRNVAVYATSGLESHGLFITGQNIMLDNVRSFNHAIHGIVLKGVSNLVANGLYSQADAQQGVLIKASSDADGGSCIGVSLSDVEINGNGVSAVGIRLTSANVGYEITNVVVAGAVIQGCTTSVSVEPAGAATPIASVQFDDIVVRGASATLSVPASAAVTNVSFAGVYDADSAAWTNTVLRHLDPVTSKTNVTIKGRAEIGYLSIGGQVDPSQRFTCNGSSTFNGEITINAANSLQTIGASDFNIYGLNYDARFRGTADPVLLYIDASANAVGIGTNVPSEKLDVNGNALVRTNLTVNQVLYFKTNTVVTAPAAGFGGVYIDATTNYWFWHHDAGGSGPGWTNKLW